MKLSPTEVDLVGKWVSVDRSVRADETSERIEWLTTNYLRKVTTSKQGGGWETLFEDPEDGRLWERTYPQSELPGGGPPRLTVMSAEQARAKYQLS